VSDGEHQSLPASQPGAFDPIAAAIGVFRTPVATMPVIAAARPWLIGVGIYILVGLANGLAGLTVPMQDLSDLEQLPPEFRDLLVGLVSGVRSPAAALIGAFILNPIGLLITTGIFYGVGYLFGGRGPFSALLATVAYAALPGLPLAPLTALLNLAGPNFTPLTSLLSFGAGVWTIVLQVLAVRASLGLSTGRAVATVLVPLLVLIVLACVLAVIMVALVINLAASGGGR
jgi:hypothetical protein